MLRISKLTDYAIVVLAYLAREAHVCVHPATSIAEATDIPQPTVAKVLKTLTKEGLLLSSRGASGGYALSRDPARINVAQIVAAMEGPLSLTACSTEHLGACHDEAHCQISGHWPRINRAVLYALEEVTLLDLSRPAVPSSHSLPSLRARS